MSENIPANTGTDQKAMPSESKSDKNSASGRVVKKSAMVVDLIFNMILVGSLCFIGYMVYEQNKAIEVLFERQNSIGSQRNEAIDQIGQLQSSIQNLENALVEERTSSAEILQNHSAEIDRLQNELISTRLRITSNNSGASQAWLLAEASSLLRLAQQHLVVSQSVRTAQALFLAADDVLKQIDDPSIFSVREILAGELAAIRSVTEVDIRDIYLSLGAISEQINTLQVNNDLQAQLEDSERVQFAQEAAEEAGAFSRFFSWIGNSLDSYFVVRRRDLPIQPLMTPGQETALKQLIQLQIEQGRTALVSAEQEIYTESLLKAQSNVEQFLSGDQGVKANILETLENLGQRRIVSETPPLNRTRAALQQILMASQSPLTESVEQ